MLKAWYQDRPEVKKWQQEVSHLHLSYHALLPTGLRLQARMLIVKYLFGITGHKDRKGDTIYHYSDGTQAQTSQREQDQE